ncbi:aspartate aminotransferase family protein [Nocardia sp. CDC159]|uniref:Aspartate aminotransferase family protein n=1 Tax=Nocardia pulmonis TaxID=2951408 RepID=A0A9X2IXN3_9NOCA|nr:MULTISPECIES: aspartate aminotransferase family protein [Nocardia]MCM6774040.1 aspartate aminotransferase family protein [Nocardia pulmonis]MCM6786927.1 aspartate aminotransferase family protein [Nocardia sp. CDC159]
MTLPNGLTVEAARAEADRAYELDRRHVFHSWSAQKQIAPMTITAAQGSYVWDGEGRRLLDFSSQMVNTNIGHQHPKVIAAVQEQAAKLCTIAPQHVNAARSEAARLIAERTPGELDRIFFTNGGADAIEHAVRMARLHTGRPKVLSRYRSYHGGTETAINLTGDPRRWPNDRGAAGTVHFFGPFLYRSQFYSRDEAEETQRALAHLEHVIAFEGPETIAAIVLESVPGTAGIMVPPPGYLAGVRELCDRYGIVFVADEVMAGFGRTGKWFAIEHFDVVPDLLTFAKGVNSGYVPLGGVAIGPQIARTFDERAYPGGLTYSGHPLATAAAVATITAMAEEGIVDNAAGIGARVLGPGLRELAERHPSVGEVRGLGVFWALELVRDRTTREPLAPYGGTSPAMAEVVAACRAAGLLMFVNFNRLHAVPPCTITEAEAKEGLAILDEALAVADRHVSGA